MNEKQKQAANKDERITNGRRTTEETLYTTYSHTNKISRKGNHLQQSIITNKVFKREHMLN